MKKNLFYSNNLFIVLKRVPKYLMTDFFIGLPIIRTGIKHGSNAPSASGRLFNILEEEILTLNKGHCLEQLADEDYIFLSDEDRCLLAQRHKLELFLYEFGQEVGKEFTNTYLEEYQDKDQTPQSKEYKSHFLDLFGDFCNYYPLLKYDTNITSKITSIVPYRLTTSIVLYKPPTSIILYRPELKFINNLFFKTLYIFRRIGINNSLVYFLLENLYADIFPTKQFEMSFKDDLDFLDLLYRYHIFLKNIKFWTKKHLDLSVKLWRGKRSSKFMFLAIYKNLNSELIKSYFRSHIKGFPTNFYSYDLPVQRMNLDLVEVSSNYVSILNYCSVLSFNSFNINDRICGLKLRKSVTFKLDAIIEDINFIPSEDEDLDEDLDIDLYEYQDEDSDED